MCLAVVLLFLAAVIGEIASIVIVGGMIGTLYTLLALVAGAVLGSLVLGGRAAATLRRAAEAYARSEPVGDVLMSNAIAGFAGVLFIIPGFLSDAVALILLLPPTRSRMAARMTARLRARAEVIGQSFGAGMPFPGGPPPGAPFDGDALAGHGGVIDVDAVEVRAADEADDDDDSDGSDGGGGGARAGR
ncbi:MAG: FxsA family protein [Kofleriaceae bacterium]|nr:FxsA family protein [Kofleriaceae bacterium]